MQKTHLVKENYFEKNLIPFNYIYFLSILFFIEVILTAAFYFQFVHHEIPCPLCLLQRVCYLGIAFFILLNLRNRYSLRYEGLMQVISVILLVISTRQSLLDIYPRPGHQYIGTPIFGIHMPVWSIIISIFILLIGSIKFSIFGNKNYIQNARLEDYPNLSWIGKILMIYIILLCASNLFFVFLQCGFGSCHTFDYQLLKNFLNL